MTIIILIFVATSTGFPTEASGTFQNWYSEILLEYNLLVLYIIYAKVEIIACRHGYQYLTILLENLEC